MDITQLFCKDIGIQGQSILQQELATFLTFDGITSASLWHYDKEKHFRLIAEQNLDEASQEHIKHMLTGDTLIDLSTTTLPDSSTGTELTLHEPKDCLTFTFTEDGHRFLLIIQKQGDLATTALTPLLQRTSGLLQGVCFSLTTLNELRFLRSVTENIREGILVTDTNGKLIFANPEARHLLHLPQNLSALSNSSISDWIVQTEPQDPFTHAQNNGLLRCEDSVVRTQHHTNLPISFVIAPIREEGEIFGFVVTFRDISKLKENEQEQKNLITTLQQTHDQLIQSEKMASIGQLAAGVAHEINNPVGYIYSNLGALRQYASDINEILEAYERAIATANPAASAIEDLNTLKKELDLEYLKNDLDDLITESTEGIKRVKQIVQDLKDFSHVGESQWKWADLRKGIDSTLNVVWNEVKYKATVDKDYGEMPMVYCLPSQINQVIMNLIVNAAHAIEQQGEITLRAGVKGENWVWLSVSDTGKGILPEHLKKIFEPFFTTKPVGKGTGLGLSLSYSIVKKHGGRIEVDSTPGQGTTFKVWLPVNGPEDEPS